MTRNEILLSALQQPTDAIRRTFTHGVRTNFPGKVVFKVGYTLDKVRKLAGQGGCHVIDLPDFANDEKLEFANSTSRKLTKCGWIQIDWGQQTLELVELQLQGRFSTESHCYLIADSQDSAVSFNQRVSEYMDNLDSAVLVFSSGCWQKDESMFDELQKSTFENLVLAEGVADRIQADVQHWLDSKEIYQSHGIPWKRGMMLVGPPGNGKTHLIKALSNRFKIRCLIVRSFEEQYGSGQDTISTVFQRARQAAPCFLILEDIDTLITPENRSFFLNELDGFAANEGIFVIASANDPAKLDPALANRPSRFDRRYHFNLPEKDHRYRFLKFFTERLNSALALSEQELETIAAATEGFSTAYLKELVLSGMMDWIARDRLVPFAQVLSENVEFLSAQIQSAAPELGLRDASNSEDEE